MDSERKGFPGPERSRAETDLELAKRHAQVLGRQMEPLLASLGSSEDLLKALNQEDDPAGQANALRALLALAISSGPGVRGPDSAFQSRLLDQVVSVVRDAGADPKVRGIAATALPMLSLGRAEEILPPFLAESATLRIKSIDILETMLFLDQAGYPNPKADPSGRRSPSSDFRALLADHVAMIAADVHAGEEERARASHLLSLFKASAPIRSMDS